MKINFHSIKNFVNELKERDIKTIYISLSVEDIPEKTLTDKGELSTINKRVSISLQAIHKNVIIQYSEIIGEAPFYEKDLVSEIEKKVTERKEGLMKELSEFIIKEGWVTV